MTFAAAVVVARCCYTLSQMISVEENPTPAVAGLPSDDGPGTTVGGGGYMVRCGGLGVRVCGKGRGVVPVWRGEWTGGRFRVPERRKGNIEGGRAGEEG